MTEREQDVLDTEAAGPLVIRGGLLRGLGYVASSLLGLLGIALVTRYLGVVEFGRFQTVIALITVVATLTDAGMAALGLREYAQRTGPDRDALMRSLLGLRIALTIAGGLIAVTAGIVVGYDSTLLVGTALAAVGLALTVVYTTLTIPLAAELRNLPVTLLDVGRQALTTGVYAVLVVAGAGLAAFLGATIPVGVVLVAASAVLLRGRISMPSWDLDAWWQLLKVAAAFAAATAVGTIYLYAAQILVAAVTDARETGLFAASFRTFVVVGAIPGLLISVAFPLLSRAARDDAGRLAYALQRLQDTSIILGLGAALGVGVGAPAIIAIMAGPEFADSEPALRIQAVTLLASFALAPISFALLSLHLHRGLLLANAAAVAVLVPSVGFLAAAWGATGAAAGTVAAEAALAAGYFVALHRASPEVVPRPGRAIRAVPAAGVALAVVALGLPAVPAAALALLVYAVLIVVVGAVPDELREIVPRRRR